MKGTVSFIIPLETTVAVVRLDDKVVGKIILHHKGNCPPCFVYIPRGYTGPRQALAGFWTFDDCKESVAQYAPPANGGPICVGRKPRVRKSPRVATQSPAGEPQGAPAS